MTNPFDLNKFNTVMSQASDAILCNSDCREQREAEKLKQNYQNAQTNLASASNQVEVAQKNYVTFTQGEPAYNELLGNQLEQKAQLIADQFNENFNEESIKIKSQINTYNGLLINFKNVFDLERKYREENRELYKELKEETNDVLTNERKTYYQDQNIDSLKFYYYYFLLSIYVIFVICFAAFSLMYPSQTSWKVKLALLVGFIALPFISTWVLGKIIYLIYEAYNLLPKNVYNQKTY
jgi:uncharacterized protein (UPF0305 family)